MSILLNLPMPKNCAFCPLSEYRNSSLGQILDCKQIGTVGTPSRDTHNVLKRRHPNCPLIEVPTPHGRLVDIKSVEEWKCLEVDEDYQEGWNDALYTVVENAPTVIEAEGSKE